MSVVIEKLRFENVEVVNLIATDDAVGYISNELKKYEYGIGDHPYFNWYRERYQNDGEDYRFSWQWNHDDTEMIADTKTAYIYENKDRNIEWTII